MGSSSMFGPPDAGAGGLGDIGPGGDLTAVGAVISEIGGELSDINGVIGSIGSGLYRVSQAVEKEAALGDQVNQAIWGGLLRPFLQDLLSWLKDLWTHPLDAIKKLAALVDKLRRVLDDLFVKYIHPILDMLQRFRRILELLQVFHVKWAAALDRRIAGIEAAITKPYLLLHGKLSEVISWISLVTNPAGFLNAGVMVWSIAGAWNEIRGLLFGGQGLFWNSFLGGAPSGVSGQARLVGSTWDEWAGQWPGTGTGG